MPPRHTSATTCTTTPICRLSTVCIANAAPVEAGETKMTAVPAIPERRSLAELAVDLLREQVLTGEIPPGQRLNEVELAGRMRISRGPLREAIRQLTSEGLLVYRPHRGTYVRLADA